jgi:hypothetical protein
MKKNFEYKEPEFKVVIANCEDVLTASGEGPTPTGNLPVTTNDWVTPSVGFTL